METQRVLISIDDILDTRLAVLAKHYPAYATKLASPDNLKKWCLRVVECHDEIGLSAKDFRELYRQRDTEILKHARPTHFFSEIDDFVTECLSRTIADPHKVKAVEIHLNTYPYKLSKEQQAAYCSLLHSHTGERVSISPVYISYQQLTPVYMRANNYSVVYMYDFLQWVLHHYNVTVTDNPSIYAPDVTIYTPSVFASMDLLKEAVEATNPKGETYEPNAGLQFMFKAYFSLEPINVEFFSLAQENALKRILMRNFQIEQLRSMEQ